MVSVRNSFQRVKEEDDRTIRSLWMHHCEQEQTEQSRIESDVCSCKWITATFSGAVRCADTMRLHRNITPSHRWPPSAAIALSLRRLWSGRYTDWMELVERDAYDALQLALERAHKRQRASLKDVLRIYTLSLSRISEWQPWKPNRTETRIYSYRSCVK